MIYIDRKFLLLNHSRLSLFAEKREDLFNFRCPYCGDSKKNKVKCRAYVYKKDESYFFKCFNCHVSTTFGGFLKYLDISQYKAYCVERFASNINSKFGTFVATGNTAKPIVSVAKESLKYVSDMPLDTIKALPDDHYAKVYITARMIPEAYWDEIYYTDNYKEFVAGFFPGREKEKDNFPTDARIVLLYTTSDGIITYVTGRALGAEKIRYLTVKANYEVPSDKKKVFGFSRLNKDKNVPVYVTEGQFDAMFLPNAVACGDSNLNGMASFLNDLGYENLVLVFDNTPRNKEIVREIKDAIEDGQNVTLLPYDEQAKDINEMILSGKTTDEVKSLIDENTFQGLTANMKFIEWRKC